MGEWNPRTAPGVAVGRAEGPGWNAGAGARGAGAASDVNDDDAGGGDRAIEAAGRQREGAAAESESGRVPAEASSPNIAAARRMASAEISTAFPAPVENTLAGAGARAPADAAAESESGRVPAEASSPNIAAARRMASAEISTAFPAPVENTLAGAGAF